MFKTVNEQTKLTRLSICSTCEEYSARIKTCKQCGCYMPAKAMFATSTCPVDKWTNAEPGSSLINQLEEMIVASWNKQ